MRNALHDEDPGVRGVAAQVLGALGDKESLPQIKELLQDESEYVRNAVRDVVSKLEPAS